jgi:hypothetical protein
MTASGRHETGLTDRHPAGLERSGPTPAIGVHGAARHDKPRRLHVLLPLPTPTLLHLLLLRPTLLHRDATTTVLNNSLPPLNPSASMRARQDEDNDSSFDGHLRLGPREG